MNSVPAIVTRVAHTGTEELRFCGHRVFAELLGRASISDMLVLGLCGHVPTTDERAVIDDIITVMSSADPRMWPFKITRLAAAFGTPAYATAATIIAAEGGMFGPNRMLACAAWLDELAAVDAQSDEAILAALDQGTEAFGVHYRARDERFEALMRQLEARGRHELRYAALCRRVVRLAREHRQREPHVFFGIAAVALDARIPTRSVGGLATIALFHCAMPNAFEGAEQRPTILCELPAEVIDYQGPAARRSPRAERNSP